MIFYDTLTYLVLHGFISDASGYRVFKFRKSTDNRILNNVGDVIAESDMIGCAMVCVLRADCHAFIIVLKIGVRWCNTNPVTKLRYVKQLN